MSNLRPNLLTAALEEAAENSQSVVLLGHLNPDGDCIGTTLGLYNYLQENYGGLSVKLFLDNPDLNKFGYLSNSDRILVDYDENQRFDLCITMDASDTGRLGIFLPYFETAKKTVCLDHHRTNASFAMENHIDAEASSCSEVLFELLDESLISLRTAECLYTGIVHDTGVFKHSNTRRRTMEIAGILLEKGVNSSEIIDGSFYRKTFVQNHIMGHAVEKSALYFDGKVIASILNADEMAQYGACGKDLDGIIDQLRVTEGVEVAVFIYEKKPSEYKVSLRATSYADVAKVASVFGGGGHTKAAGCTLNGAPEDILETILKELGKQFQEITCTTE